MKKLFFKKNKKTLTGTRSDDTIIFTIWMARGDPGFLQKLSKIPLPLKSLYPQKNHTTG